MKKLYAIAVSLFLSVCLASAALAHEGHSEIPAKVSLEHWSCKEIAELAQKYGAPGKLPAAEILEKRELAAPLLAIIDKVLEKCGKEGAGAIPEGAALVGAGGHRHQQFSNRSMTLRKVSLSIQKSRRYLRADDVRRRRIRRCVRPANGILARCHPTEKEGPP